MPLFFLKMALQNAFRHRLRAFLTILGIVIAILAFGLLRTVVSAWYGGVDAASDSRLITRNATSLTFPLPISYQQKIRQIDGVESVSYANWFGGIYIDERNFFPNFAVQLDTYLPLYPEFRFDPTQYKALQLNKRGCAVGEKLARRYGWKVGDVIPLKGTIFPGNFPLVVEAIFSGTRKSTDTNLLLFHWSHLNDRMEKLFPRRANNTGVFVIGIRNPDQAADIARHIDAEFRNSLAETLTETEKAFQLSFVAMTEAIVVAIEAVAYVVILIIMAVMANTMTMAARERSSEYATLKALGFAPVVVSWLIVAESLLLALIGGGIGITLTFPVTASFGQALDNIFPVFNVTTATLWLQAGAALLVGVIAAIVPAIQAARVNIVNGLRAVG